MSRGKYLLTAAVTFLCRQVSSSDVTGEDLFDIAVGIDSYQQKSHVANLLKYAAIVRFIITTTFTHASKRYIVKKFDSLHLEKEA